MHQVDESTPLEEIVRTLDDLVRWGKVRYVGVSNYPAWRMALMLSISAQGHLEPIVSAQPRYNLLYREMEAEVGPFCRASGLGIMAYNPLAGGILTGRYRSGDEPSENTRFTLPGIAGPTYRQRYWQQEQLQIVDALQEVVQRSGRTLTQTAVAWVLANPDVTSVIIGASRHEQVVETLGAVELTLGEEERQACDAAWYKVPRSPNDAIDNRPR